MNAVNVARMDRSVHQPLPPDVVRNAPSRGPHRFGAQQWVFWRHGTTNEAIRIYNVCISIYIYEYIIQMNIILRPIRAYIVSLSSFM